MVDQIADGSCELVPTRGRMGIVGERCTISGDHHRHPGPSGAVWHGCAHSDDLEPGIEGVDDVVPFVFVGPVPMQEHEERGACSRMGVAVGAVREFRFRDVHGAVYHICPKVNCAR